MATLPNESGYEADRARIWDAWRVLPDDCPSPVKTIARDLGLPTARVASTVYPSGYGFGIWADDQEPDLP